MPSLKVFHTGDIHMCAKFRTWVNRALSHAVATAVEQQCDLAIIAGDSFDSAISAHEPAFAEFVGHIVALSNHMPVVLLYGTMSHDRPGSLDVFRAIPSKHPIFVVDKPTQFQVGEAFVSCLPSINMAEIPPSEGKNAWTKRALEGFSAANIAARAEGKPTLLVTHGTINGSTTESHYALVSPDHEMSVESLAAAEADAVMINHIHRHQSWPDVLTPSGARTTIAYPGSLARLVHGHLEPVGFLIWDIEPGSARFAFHESPARQLVEIAFEGPPDLDELRTLAADIGPDDAVRIRWSIDEEHVASVDKALIREIFAAAETVKLEPRVLPVQRTRAAGIGQARTLAERIRVWCEVTGSTPAADRLTARLERLQSADPDVIVRGITGTDTRVDTIQIQEAA